MQAMAKLKTPLIAGTVYHIYNRGINGENIFRKHDNYIYFLSLYAKYCEPVAETFAYCLLGNHFHFLVRIKDDLPTYASLYPRLPQTPKSKQTVAPYRQFSHFFNAYAQSFNKIFNRTGSLFEENFQRKIVDSPRYFTQLIQYIHFNPQKHGFVTDFREYPYSSYHSHLSTKATRLKRAVVHDWFGSAKDFEAFHITNPIDEKLLSPYLIEFD
jgi:REP element-mobilizing transposase RayT